MQKVFLSGVLLLIGLCIACSANAGIATQIPVPTDQEPPNIGSTDIPEMTIAPIITPTATRFPPQDWEQWPLLPEVSENARQIYQTGLAIGTDPTHFSILGDCQSMPLLFMGRFVTDPIVYDGLDADLRQIVDIFSDSMLRKGPANYPGTTAGAVLWTGWLERTGITYCRENETPLDCELRVWNPSIIFINLGTHWEARNIDYMRKVLDALVEKGVLPILATKADNREGDERLNQETALLAYEYDIPLWNFWSAVQTLPNGGLRQEQEVADIYLTDEGLEIHRVTGLQALQTVYSRVITP